MSKKDVDPYAIDEKYFLWLCNVVDADDPEEGYLGILRRLYDTEFSEDTAKLIPNDDNRIADGISLRGKFCRKYRIKGCELLDRKPCSILEMMIALAMRIEESFGYSHCDVWFWEMMENLGLQGMTDDVYFDQRRQQEVNEILRNLRMRKYSKDGFGGLFPVSKTSCDRSKMSFDQRKMEIWDQMNNYLVENYMN